MFAYTKNVRENLEAPTKVHSEQVNNMSLPLKVHSEQVNNA